MSRLFGIDIAQVVSDALESAGNLTPGVLIKFAADPNNSTRHNFQGFVETRSIRRQDTLVVEPAPILTIIGASISPAVVPSVNDQAELASMTWEIVRLIRRDPASAVYEFEVR